MMASNPAAAARYTPGSWLGVVRSGTVVLLRPDSAQALVDSLWELLATGPEVHEVLDAVSSASGGSLARLPWFAIVSGRGSLQVFLRGGIDLTVHLPSGPVELSGREVTTWTERRFAAADGLSRPSPGPTAPAPPSPRRTCRWLTGWSCSRACTWISQVLPCRSARPPRRSLQRQPRGPAAATAEDSSGRGGRRPGGRRSRHRGRAQRPWRLR